ncbi:hypothetical protein UFOVP225_110 [uncultured Caudovirales phage]|uniref:Uncharacterized protein n=1 Tax=uncultured Caudovirales phage TaxID=2100421 RepID=A0A6J5L6A0_9CAUD|nr:hypothetical protein UFOVP113_123 [uncultured Caudovirales phage]CAB5219683.1 hypothetical protein UFOVP225_110 [uncultured Caudovirales phage]
MQRAKRNAQAVCDYCDRPFYSKGRCKTCYMALYRGQLNKPKIDRVTNRKYTQNDDAEDFWEFVKRELNIG